MWIAARLLIRSIGGALDRRQVRGSALVAIRRIVYVLFVGLAVLILFAWASNSANAVLAGLILATLVASLGIQDLMKNYVSGFYILLEKHVQPGDRIRFESAEGVVSDIRLRVTLLRGEGGAQVVVPNAELFNKTVIVSKTAAVAPRRKRLPDGPEKDPAEGIEPVTR
ncbi:MAG: mechanosensitive ion channel [Chloroflexi bacterium]|nr:MAG: mechanosensitive ion channel [Chloroflexota bacterium]